MRNCNIIKRAIVEFDYELDPECIFQDILDECENLILDRVDFDELEECELSASGSFHFSDDFGYSLDYSGDGNEPGEAFFRISDKEFVELADIPEGDERHDYAFIFHRVINSAGDVVALWDRM